MKRRTSALSLAVIGLLVSVVLGWHHIAMAAISDGVVAYYPFNGNASDETGHGYDGTVDGATLTDDRFGNPMSAYSFDGSNDKILIGQEPNFPSWTTYAVSVWFLNNGGGDQGRGYGQKVLSKAEFFTDFHLSVGGDDNVGHLSWWSSQGGFDSVTDVNKDYRDNVWHHAVLNKHTASTGDLWVDGVLQASSTTLAAVVNSVNLVIGYTEHSDGFQQKHWSGKIDDIRIYNRVLSESEISALFAEGGAPPPDQDDDGIPDSEDACPDSDLSTTIIIDGCDSGVANTRSPTGCTISDQIMQCADDVNNHGKFVSCVAHLTNELKKGGTITGQQKGAIQSCAAQANIP